MGHSPLLGADAAPGEPSGRDTRSLGPSDLSDSGSDVAGIAGGDDTGLPIEETLQEAGAGAPAADIGADRVVRPHRGGAADGDATLSDDEDADLAFVDAAQAGDPLDEEPPAEDGDDTAPA